MQIVERSNPLMSPPPKHRLGLPASHYVVIGVAVAFAVLWVAPTWVAPAAGSDRSGLETQLSDTIGLRVDPGSVRWMHGPSAAGLKASLTWYELVFTAKAAKSAPSDLYRIAVRTTDGKSIFAARDLKNLSMSPDGDEGELTVSPPFAATVTRALGCVRSVTIFDFRAASIEDTSSSLSQKWMRRITNQLETGHPDGIGKTVVRFAAPPGTLGFTLKGDTLHLTWTDIRGNNGDIAVRADREESTHPGIIVTSTSRPMKRPVLWAVDTIRSFRAVGPGPVEWLEGRVFAAQDFVRRTKYRVFGSAEATVSDAPDAPSVRTELNLPTGLEIGPPVSTEIWPPPTFEPPIFSRRMVGEGEWQPTGPDFIKRLRNAPSAFYKSAVRPDRERPYVTVKLIAMDMRQLELHMVGGIEDPQSTTGSAGDGRIPRKKALMDRTVAAFNGAFKTEHGAYGMMVEDNVLLPPKADSATVATLENGTVLMGTWPEGMDIPDEMESYRQNMDPLVENGVVNPKRRYLWGFTLGNDLTKMQTVRSGLCMSDKGYLVYAWGEDVTAHTLGIAMNAAGCTYGLHLDMNPYHTAFIYYLFHLDADGERPKYESESAFPETMYSPHRYINGAPKDFFFLALKNLAPGSDWKADGLAQTVPAFLPSVFRKDSNGCRMTAVHLDRVTAHLTPGVIPDAFAPVDYAPDNPVEKSTLLVDVNLGPWSSTRGQIVHDSLTAETPRQAAILAVTRNGIPKIETWPLADPAAIVDTVQGEWFLTDTTGKEPIVGFGTRDDWFFIAEGPAADVKVALTAENVRRTMYFPNGERFQENSRVFVRDEKGMIDHSGRRISDTDMTTTHLQFSAMPRPLGVQRLEARFPKNDMPRAVAKEEHNGPD